MVLFLSNIPFFHEMKMEEKETCAMEMEACKSGNDGMMKGCHKPKEKEKQNKECCAKTETTCICICCFQFASPSPASSKFLIVQSTIQKQYSPYHPSHWKDPFISIPWQPPDLA